MCKANVSYGIKCERIGFTHQAYVHRMPLIQYFLIIETNIHSSSLFVSLFFFFFSFFNFTTKIMKSKNFMTHKRIYY
jgi:hypothetical protein